MSRLIKNRVIISDNPAAAESLRQERLPDYRRCQFADITSQPYDHIGEEMPLSVRCSHAIFGQQYDGICVAQCKLAGEPYGIKKQGE